MMRLLIEKKEILLVGLSQLLYTILEKSNIFDHIINLTRTKLKNLLRNHNLTFLDLFFCSLFVIIVLLAAFEVNLVASYIKVATCDLNHYRWS